jgi:hypothetical protein
MTVLSVAERLKRGLLAEDAATATTGALPCILCHRAIGWGDRFARLVPSGGTAHLQCIAATAWRRPVIR